MHQKDYVEDHESSPGSDRRRVAQACKRCSLSKVRCDGSKPCQRCDQQGYECCYEPPAKRRSPEAAVNNNKNHNKSSSKRSKVAKQQPGALGKNENSVNSSQQIMVAKAPADATMATANLTQQVEEGYLAEARITSSTTLAISTVPELNTAGYDTFQPGDLSTAGTDIQADFDSSIIMQTPSLSYGDTFDVEGWLNYEMDVPFQPAALHPELAFETFNDIWLASLEPLKPPPPVFSANVPPIPMAIMDPSEIAELYSRSHSPAIDKDNVEPRQYVPTSIEFDALLILPSLEHLTVDEVDQENLAHVDELLDNVTEKVAELSIHGENSSHFPPFVELRIPPTRILNAWVQLYFEHFHPVFPILHKPSFSVSRTHWLLIFTVAAIGAHFSNLRDVQPCIRPLHELIRRHSSLLVICISFFME